MISFRPGFAQCISRMQVNRVYCEGRSLMQHARKQAISILCLSSRGTQNELLKGVFRTNLLNKPFSTIFSLWVCSESFWGNLLLVSIDTAGLPEGVFFLRTRTVAKESDVPWVDPLLRSSLSGQAVKKTPSATLLYMKFKST
jgi:hypothetical protein